MTITLRIASSNVMVVSRLKTFVHLHWQLHEDPWSNFFSFLLLFEECENGKNIRLAFLLLEIPGSATGKVCPSDYAIRHRHSTIGESRGCKGLPNWVEYWGKIGQIVC